MTITISEGLGWLKTLQARHAELVALRNANSATQINRYGNAGDERRVEPTYSAIGLDRRITLIAREIRLLGDAIKRTNASTEVHRYERNDDVLGELEG